MTTFQRQARPHTIGEVLRRRWPIPLHEVDILLAHTLHCNPVFIYSHPEQALTNKQWRALQQTIKRRRQNEPIAYITKHKEFFGLDFTVTPAVLIPRPDTELLVETVIAAAPRQAKIADIGTGSGNIAISIKQTRPDCSLYATDISVSALTVARHNAKRLQSAVRFYRGDVLQALPKKLIPALDVICFNAPYLTKAEAKKTGLAYEPQLALTPFGKPTQLIERLLSQAQCLLKPKTLIAFEIGYQQANAVQKLCRHYFPHSIIIIKKDLGGFDRLVLCKI